LSTYINCPPYTMTPRAKRSGVTKTHSVRP